MRPVARVAEVVSAQLAPEEEGAARYELVAYVALNPVYFVGLLVNPGLELMPSTAGGRC